VLATGLNSASFVVHHRGDLRFIPYRDVAEVISLPVDEAVLEWL
jgi:hypothetical protein